MLFRIHYRYCITMYYFIQWHRINATFLLSYFILKKKKKKIDIQTKSGQKERRNGQSASGSVNRRQRGPRASCVMWWLVVQQPRYCNTNIIATTSLIVLQAREERNRWLIRWFIGTHNKKENNNMKKQNKRIRIAYYYLLLFIFYIRLRRRNEEENFAYTLSGLLSWDPWHNSSSINQHQRDTRL